MVPAECSIPDLYFIFTWDSGTQEVEKFSILGVHDGSLDELHHRVASVLELGVTPQAESACRRRAAINMMAMRMMIIILFKPFFKASVQ